jgi:hypothetical protein
MDLDSICRHVAIKSNLTESQARAAILAFHECLKSDSIWLDCMECGVGHEIEEQLEEKA